MRRMRGGSAVKRVFRRILSCERTKLEVETRKWRFRVRAEEEEIVGTGSLGKNNNGLRREN